VKNSQVGKETHENIIAGFNLEEIW